MLPSGGAGTRWAIYREELPKGDAGLAGRIIWEVISFRSLFYWNKSLWTLSWLFHATLFLVFLDHLRILYDYYALLGITGGAAETISFWLGGVAGAVCLGTLILLLGRRAVRSHVRAITGFGDYLLIILFALILITGNCMKFHIALGIPTFLVHMLLIELLLVVTPFSKFIHFLGTLLANAIRYEPFRPVWRVR
jgi:nitrate reductase gamma subunit